MKRKIALSLVVLLGLTIFLALPSTAGAVEENICLANYKKCYAEVMKADVSFFVTWSALVACDLEKLACLLTMQI